MLSVKGTTVGSRHLIQLKQANRTIGWNKTNFNFVMLYNRLSWLWWRFSEQFKSILVWVLENSWGWNGRSTGEESFLRTDLLGELTWNMFSVQTNEEIYIKVRREGHLKHFVKFRCGLNPLSLFQNISVPLFYLQLRPHFAWLVAFNFLCRYFRYFEDANGNLHTFAKLDNDKMVNVWRF